MEGSVSIVQHLLDPVHGEPAGGGWYGMLRRCVRRLVGSRPWGWASFRPDWWATIDPSQVGAVCLLHFFIASVFAKDRLTPRRIKIW